MAYTVAEAEVTVVPDARNFGKALREQINLDADKAGREAGEKIAKAMRERLAETKPKVDVDADTKPATRAVDEFLARTQAKAKVAGRQAGEQLGDGVGEGFRARSALIGAAIGLGLAAGAPLLVAGAGILFGGLAALVAHNDDIVEHSASRLGRDVGEAYRRIGTEVAPDLAAALDRVRDAALGLAPAVGRIFADLGPAIRGVTDGVTGLVSNAMPGLEAAIATGRPVFEGLQHFLEAIGTGLSNFFLIVSEHAPAMGGALSALGDAFDGLFSILGEVLGAGAELGNMVLPVLADVLGAVADALGFMAPVLPGIVLGLIGMKVAGAVGTMMGTLATKLQLTGANAMVAVASLRGIEGAGLATGTGFAAASAGARGLQAAMGPIGWLLLGISTVLPFLIDGFSSQSAVQGDVTASADAMTQALQASKGAIDDNVRATAAKQAQDLGLLDQAKLWGVSASTVVDAVLGQADAMDEVNSAADRYEAKLAGLNREAAQGADGTNRYNTALGETITANEDAIGASQDFRGALGDLSGATVTEIANQQELAGVLGYNNSIQEINKERLQAIANTAGSATAEINLFKGALDALTGNAVSLGDAEAAITVATDNAVNSIKDMDGALVGANGQLDIHARKGAAAWQALGQIRDADNQLIGTMIEHGATAEEVAARDAQLRDSFINTAQQMGFSRGEAERLADQILGIPAERRTEFEADIAGAAEKVDQLKTAIEGIHGKTIFINAEVTGSGAVALNGQRGAALAAGGLIHAYAGGGIEPMAGGFANIVPPNTLRLIGDRVTDDEAYIPINDSARSLSILATTAARMGQSLVGVGSGSAAGKTDARQYAFTIQAGGDPQSIVRSVRDAQLDLEFLHG